MKDINLKTQDIIIETHNGLLGSDPISDYRFINYVLENEFILGVFTCTESDDLFALVDDESTNLIEIVRIVKESRLIDIPKKTNNYYKATAISYRHDKIPQKIVKAASYLNDILINKDTNGMTIDLAVLSNVLFTIDVIDFRQLILNNNRGGYKITYLG